MLAVKGDDAVGCVLFCPDGKGSGRLFQMVRVVSLQRYTSLIRCAVLSVCYCRRFCCLFPALTDFVISVTGRRQRVAWQRLGSKAGEPSRAGTENEAWHIGGHAALEALQPGLLSQVRLRNLWRAVRGGRHCSPPHAQGNIDDQSWVRDDDSLTYDSWRCQLHCQLHASPRGSQ